MKFANVRENHEAFRWANDGYNEPAVAAVMWCLYPVAFLAALVADVWIAASALWRRAW